MKREFSGILLGLALAVVFAFSGCKTSMKTASADGSYLPFLKNSPNECYFLDEFMPTPDGLVKGKTGSLKLRYYSYKAASYKDWDSKHVVLSFYSSDDRCWSLFEEYFVAE
jgi:hypothetical protein